jgi:ATP-dependent Clp protease protease subunit
MTRPQQWFRLQNAVEANDQTRARIDIIDFIGDWFDDAGNRFWGESIGVTARAFVEQLAALPDAVQTIHVHINSPGGDVQGGINIANALREQASKGRVVETFVDGLAASIASVIAMAGTRVHIADNALLMVHDPWSVVVGNSGDMRKQADVLDAVRGQIVNTYRWHSSLEASEIEALMAAETWMDADEAIARGFATDKVEGLQIADALSPRAFARLKVPARFENRIARLVERKAPAPASDVLRLCREAACIDLAEGLVNDGATVEQVQAALASAVQARAAAAAREMEIRALCATANVPSLADAFTRSRMALGDIRAVLTTITALADHVEIDGALLPPADPGTSMSASWKAAHQRATRPAVAPGSAAAQR